MKQYFPDEQIRCMQRCIGYRVAFFRSERNWTQEDLIDELQKAGLPGVSVNTISCIENGHTLPGLPMIFFLSKVFCCKTDELLEDYQTYYTKYVNSL